MPPELPAGGSRLPPWIPVPCRGSLPPTLHPHLGNTQPHGHTGVWRSPLRGPSGVSSPQPQLGMMPTVTHLPHTACAAPGTCPRGRLRHSGPQNHWGFAAPMSHWLPWEIPCAPLGTQPLPRSHIQPPNHRAPLSPALRAGVGRGRSRSAPPCPSRWILCRAHAAPCQTTSAQSLSVPGVPTALQHHPWLG